MTAPAQRIIAAMSELPVVIVGSGFSGLAAAVMLQRAGIHSFTILEKADRVGGTWRDNTYPGAACDVPSHLYSYSFAPNPRWSRTYGNQAEILAYLERCADRFGLRRHIRFGAEVTAASFDEPTGTWTVHLGGGGSLPARALVLGNGALHLPSYPAIPGLERFEGARFHSSAWDHGFDLRGKRVAVIGTGASAIQFVPEIAPEVAQLHLFQRTPPWIMPKPDRLMTGRERWWLEHVPGAHRARRTALYWMLETRVLALVHQTRMLDLGEKLAREFLADSVADPALRARLAPRYRMGCKRVLLSNDYYPALQRDNVEVVSEPITSIGPGSVRTADGAERPVDALILGTGFRLTDYLSKIRITGRGGRDLEATWRGSPKTYLGITVSGFPNLYLLMGPNTGLGHNSMIFMIEAQARYAAQSIAALRDRRLSYMDVRPAVQDAFDAELQRKLGTTVWATGGCHSWYQADDGRVVLWPGFTFDYWRRTRRVDLADYELAPVSGIATS